MSRASPALTRSGPFVLVTGASGFVGRHVTQALSREEWAVRHAVRSLSGSNQEVLIDTIGPATDWRAALAGINAVVHLAARVHHPNEEHEVELYRKINIDGTLHLARCAAESGVRQFVFVSSALVHGSSNNGRAPFSENDVLAPRGVYGESKAAAEVGLEALAKDSDMCVTVIRPPLVYGAGAKGNFKLLADAVRFGIPLPFASIQNRRAFLSVQNLSSFVSYQLSHAVRQFDVFLLADEEQVSTPEFIERIAKAAGVKARLFQMPESVLASIFRITGQPNVRDSLLGSFNLDVSKAISMGWRPQINLDEGLRLALSER